MPYAKKNLETDFKLLQDKLQSGVQELNSIVNHMRLCESAMDKSGPTLARAQPLDVIQDPSSDPAAQVDAPLRPSQLIDSPRGQPTAG